MKFNIAFVVQNNLVMNRPTINKLRGWYRYRFLVMGKRKDLLQPFIREWLGKVNVRRGMRVKIDIDPYNFL